MSSWIICFLLFLPIFTRGEESSNTYVLNYDKTPMNIGYGEKLYFMYVDIDDMNIPNVFLISKKIPQGVHILYLVNVSSYVEIAGLKLFFNQNGYGQKIYFDYVVSVNKEKNVDEDVSMEIIYDESIDDELIKILNSDVDFVDFLIS